jgi:hypothetical protein
MISLIAARGVLVYWQSVGWVPTLCKFFDALRRQAGQVRESRHADVQRAAVICQVFWLGRYAEFRGHAASKSLLVSVTLLWTVEDPVLPVLSVGPCQSAQLLPKISSRENVT